MVDIREDILARLLEVVATIPNLRSAHRNNVDITGTTNCRRRSCSTATRKPTTRATFRCVRRNRPTSVQMTPEIVIAQQADEVGSDLTTLRRELIKRVLTDTELNEQIVKTGRHGNGAIRYLGCQTDVGWMRSLHGALRAQFMFKYTLSLKTLVALPRLGQALSSTLTERRAAMPTSPNVKNYHIGKGIVSFKEAGASVFTDLGNAPSFVYTPTIEKLEHFSSREGVKTKDFTAITQVGATIKFTLDEITGHNLAFFALAEQGTDTDGNITLSGLSKTEFTGDIKVVGTNDIGQQVDFLATVSFVPSGDFSFITAEDEFTVIEIEAEVQKDANGDFGVWTIRDEAATA